MSPSQPTTMKGVWCHVGVAIFTILAVIVTMILHLLAFFPRDLTKGLYIRNHTELWTIDGNNFLDVEWIKWLWVCVYIYQILLALYCLTPVCRPRNLQYNLCRLVHFSALVMYCIGLINVIIWMFFKDQFQGDRHYFSSLALLAACLLFYVSFSIFLASMTYYKTIMVSQSIGDVVLTRVLVYNGLSALFTWVSVLLLFQVAQILDVYTTLETYVIQYLWLTAVMLFILVLFFIQVFGTRSGMEYTVMPFFVVLFSYAAVISNNYKHNQHEKLDNIMIYVTAALMGLVGILIIVAIGFSVVKNRKFGQPQEKLDAGMGRQLRNLSRDAITRASRSAEIYGSKVNWFSDDNDNTSFDAPHKTDFSS